MEAWPDIWAVVGNPGQFLPLAEQPCLIGGYGESRDVVQPRRQWQEYLFKCARSSEFAQFVQRNRLAEREGSGLGPAQHGDAAHRAQRMSDIARERADIGALGNAGGEGD